MTNNLLNFPCSRNECSDWVKPVCSAGRFPARLAFRGVSSFTGNASRLHRRAGFSSSQKGTVTIDELLSKRDVEDGEAYSVLQSITTTPLNEEELYWKLRNLKWPDFRETLYWKCAAQLCKARASNRCQLCNRQFNLAAHHRTYTIHGREHLHIDDLTCLCKGCHHRHHFPNGESKPVHTSPQEVPGVPVEDDKNILLTNERVLALRTGGSFTTATIIGMGLKPKTLQKGWAKALVGTLMLRELYAAGMAGVGVYAGKRGLKQ